MSKYQVGEELIEIGSAHEDRKKIAKNTKLSVDSDNYAKLTLSIKIVKVKYDNPNIILTYKNHEGRESRIFASCLDPENFDENRALEKALLKAFQNEIIDLSVMKNCKILIK